ncbi:MAG: DUF1540 domain-containing protein [Firmicutes bacterium]|nr:DUF1540 domain-containing protein [Bacillota bacterium]
MVQKTAKKHTGVKCTVDSCYYWGSGNVCEADEIEIKNNVRNFNMEIGTMGAMEAQTSEETMCATYRPKNSK